MYQLFVFCGVHVHFCPSNNQLLTELILCRFLRVFLFMKIFLSTLLFANLHRINDCFISIIVCHVKDINECEQSPLPCHDLASCTNTNGFFIRTYIRGYERNGNYCTGNTNILRCFDIKYVNNLVSFY